jgi:SAM-dependent methyltransferase
MIREEWEKRALRDGDQLYGVLPRNLPKAANQYLHEQHFKVINVHLLSELPRNSKILDIGCGYGRISQAILRERPDLRITGMDFSFPYCQLYQQHVKESVFCADINQLPLKAETFDAILVVTVLMYVPTATQNEVVIQLSRLLKPKGRLLLIEPGAEFLKLAGLLRPSQEATGGSGLTSQHFSHLGNQQIQVAQVGGYPGFSGALPWLIVGKSVPFMLRGVLGIAGIFDNYFSRFHKYSFHRWLLAQKT